MPGRCLLAVLLLAGCATSGHDATQARPSKDPRAFDECSHAVRVGQPITGMQLLDGCRTGDGRRLKIDYYPCRGTGNVVALLERDGRAWSGETGLGWEERPVRGKRYGTWGGGYSYDSAVDPNSDAAGCIISWPDLVEPPPS